MGKRPAPLTAEELREIKRRWGQDRVVRLLLWEISRLRQVLLLLYRQIVRLSAYEPDRIKPDLDPHVEEAIEAEPVIREHSRVDPYSYKYGRKHRWPHMSEEKEDALNETIEREETERERKMKARDAR